MQPVVPFGVGGLQVEAAHERAPGETRGVEQVADVLAGQDRRARGARADVETGIGVAGQREAALAVVMTDGGGADDFFTPLVWPEITLIAPGVDGP